MANERFHAGHAEGRADLVGFDGALQQQLNHRGRRRAKISTGVWEGG